ncbi:MAG: hypothetical protein NZ805_02120 [Armatimonadetes bacterium]|nr:hypothetical protein [Armatimonadota bacterium]MDW8026832.1 hypothetical protein [Armatimonadota bacterium]
MLRRMAIAALLAGALVGLTFAQPPAGGRRGQGGQPPGPPTGAPRMFARGGPMMMLGLLRSPQVQRELKITEEQRTKLEQLGEQLREKFRGLGQELRDLPPEERGKRVESMNAEVEKELAKVLDEKQLKRLKQIALQFEGYAALARPSVAKEVGLTEGQLKQIREILREANEKRRDLFQQGPPADPQARFQEMRKIRDWVDEQIGKLLTEQQKQKWQQLVGEPFKFEFQPFGGGRQQ